MVSVGGVVLGVCEGVGEDEGVTCTMAGVAKSDSAFGVGIGEAAGLGFIVTTVGAGVGVGSAIGVATGVCAGRGVAVGDDDVDRFVSGDFSLLPNSR